MQAPQLAGFAVATGVVVLVDLPIDWLVLAAMLAGGATIFAVDAYQRRRR